MIRRDYEGGLLLISQTAHAWVAGQLAVRWGNVDFARPEPWDELVMIAAQHDSGWAEWELTPRIHNDGTPVGFMEMDLDEHFAIWQRSVERMQPTNLYGALLISMHAVDLYRRRLEDDGRGDSPAMRGKIRGFIEERLTFQEKVRSVLANHPRYGPELEEERISEALRLLQTWDLLSLLLLMGPLPSDSLQDVPLVPGIRTEIHLSPRDSSTLTLKPYPFSEEPFLVRADGRWLAQRNFGHNSLFRQAYENADLLSIELVLDRG
jgi:hypothetical protein